MILAGKVNVPDSQTTSYLAILVGKINVPDWVKLMPFPRRGSTSPTTLTAVINHGDEES